jgi:CheY-like chemotaxis protein
MRSAALSTILAVDDSATMRKCLEITFQGTEFNVVAVETAQEALEKVKTLKPDLVIADASLPPNDGYELVSTIKLAAPDMPVLVLSSKQHPFDAQKGSQADGHVDKPFDTQLLQDKARELAQPGEKGDTDVPGAPKPAVKPAPAPAERQAAASSKIPAPRRKRPTPAVMNPPTGQQAAQKPSAAAAAQMRKTVPFAMPGAAKRGGASQEAVSDAIKQAADKAQPAAKPAVGSATMPGATPAAATGGAAALSAEATADLQTKLGALGLTKEQMEGVLALSREVVEQVVWDVVPTLAEVLIKEEIKRLTGD